MHGWLCFPFTDPRRLFFLGCVSIPGSGGASRKCCCTLTLQSQPSSDTSSHLQLCRCFPSICSLAVWLLFRVHLSVFPVSQCYCLKRTVWFVAAAFFGNHEQMSGSGVVCSPCSGSSGWWLEVYFSDVLCVYAGEDSQGLTGYTVCYPWKRRQPELLILGLYRRSRKGLDEQSLFILYSKFLFCTGDRYPRGVKLLFANFNLAICGNCRGGVPCYFFLCFCFLPEVSVWQPDSNFRNP